MMKPLPYDGMPYEIDAYTTRARALLADGPKSREHLLTQGTPISP